MSEPSRDAMPTATPPESTTHKRWTLHALNNGAIFGATCRGVGFLPRFVSYALGDASMWLAWRLMPSTRRALADNLRPLFPGETDRRLERRALHTLRCYARDVVDFLRAVDTPDDRVADCFATSDADAELFERLLAQGRGIILVSAHYGNWEIGSVFMRRVFQLPLTIVAMAEANEEVNRLRRDIRARLDTDTLEVRKSLDTALLIRSRLAENRIVALLIDRHVDRDRIAVRLLGQTAWFLKTPILMAYLSGAPLVPCFIERIAAGRQRVRPGTPIVVSRDIPRDQAIAQAAQAIADQIGDRIRAHPEYWYNFYPYWQAQRDATADAG